MFTFLFLVALALIGFAAGRMRRAPAWLDGAAIAALASLLLWTGGLGFNLFAVGIGVLCLAGGAIGGAASDVKNAHRRKLGGGSSGGLLNR